MMRLSVCLCSAFLVLAPRVSGADEAAARLESVSIIRAGAGASLAARTSAIAVLVAATSTNTRTVVIELVGVVAEKRDVSVADRSGMISHIAIDTMRTSGGSAVTQIRVSLSAPSHHRLRTSDHVTYIDFERVAEVEPLAARHRAPARTVKPPVIDTPNIAARRVDAPVANQSTETKPAKSPHDEPNLLARWAAVTRPLQHTPTSSSAAVLEGAWIPLVLKDGMTLFSYGDYAEVDGHVAFLLPLDDAGETPRVEAVTLRASAFDLEATARAAESVRAARYAAGRGPQEFAELSESVSAILNAVPAERDPAARVRLVETVKRRLVEWPAAHHGYRAADIREAISVLDPILNQLRAAAGMKGVEMTLAAMTDEPPRRMAFRQPMLVDLLENAMRFALLSAPSQRTAVLRATAESLERHRARLPAVWLTAGRRRVDEALKSDSHVDDAYRKLTTRILELAAGAARDGNVRAIAALQSELLARDEELGRMREDAISATMAALQIQFEIAARQQLHRERDAMGRSPRAPAGK